MTLLHAIAVCFWFLVYKTLAQLKINYERLKCGFMYSYNIPHHTILYLKSVVK